MMTPTRRNWSSDVYWRISVAIMVGMAFAVIWFGPMFVIAAHPAELRPWPSLGTIFEAVGDALSEPQRKPVAAKHRRPAPRIAKAAPARARPSQAAAYAEEPPGRDVFKLVVRERLDVPTKGVIAAIISVESRGNPRARGRAGEYGLMQIKCQTARGVGFRGPCSGLLDPATNVRYGTAYYHLALRRAGGHVDTAISRYQRGAHSNYRGCSAYCRTVKAAVR